MQAKFGLYAEFEFTEEGEERVAQTFHHLNKAYLQNLRYQAIVQRDQLAPNLQHPEEYFYAKAQLDGRIDQLTELIELVPQEAEKVTEA